MTYTRMGRMSAEDAPRLGGMHVARHEHAVKVPSSAACRVASGERSCRYRWVGPDLSAALPAPGDRVVAIILGVSGASDRLGAGRVERYRAGLATRTLLRLALSGSWPVLPGTGRVSRPAADLEHCSA